MSRKENGVNIEDFDISVEEFDLLDGKHVFSKEYEDNKKNMMREFRKNKYASVKRGSLKVAAAMAIILVSAPFVVNAATEGALFNRIWGNEGKKNVSQHDEVFESNGHEITYTYPEREYVEMDEAKAKELVGDCLTNESIVREINGTTLTICSAITDNNSMVVEFTLEKEGGVDVLEYSQLSNESKGAWFSKESTLFFNFEEGDGCIYVDLENSTEDKLLCYYYMVNCTSEKLSKLNLDIHELDCKYGEWFNDMEAHENAYSIEIPLSGSASVVKFENSSNGIIEISPIAMKLVNEKGLMLENVECIDPGEINTIEIIYNDDTKYTVLNKGYEDGDVKIDNSSYLCGIRGGEVILFNRLVDINNIKSIYVNGCEYELK